MAERIGNDLPTMAFAAVGDLRAWLLQHHATSSGIWVRIAKSGSDHRSVTFLEVLDEGLCFGWSESTRRKGDDGSYLQRFTPRRSRGTASPRNLAHVERLIKEGRMSTAGLKALGAADRTLPQREDLRRRPADADAKSR